MTKKELGEKINVRIDQSELHWIKSRDPNVSRFVREAIAYQIELLKFEQNASPSDREVILCIENTKKLLIEDINAKNKKISELDEKILEVQALWERWAMLETEITSQRNINDNK